MSTERRNPDEGFDLDRFEALVERAEAAVARLEEALAERMPTEDDSPIAPTKCDGKDRGSAVRTARSRIETIVGALLIEAGKDRT